MAQVHEKILFTLVLGCSSATALSQDGYGVGSSNPIPTIVPPASGGGTTPIVIGLDQIGDFITQATAEMNRQTSGRR